MSPHHAYRSQDPNLPPILHNGKTHGVVDQERADEETDHTERGQVQLKRDKHPLHLSVALRRTTDQDGRPQLRLQFLNHAVHGNAGCSHDVHPIKLAESIQLHLGGGNIHDNHGIPSCFIVGKRQEPAHGRLESTWPNVDRHGITSGHAQAGSQLTIHKDRIRTEQGVQ